MGEFFVSKRMVAVALTVGLGAGACGEGVNHYIENARSPHSYNENIPEGRVLPTGVEPEFMDMNAYYQASEDAIASTGIYDILVFCGNPINKRDTHNLYASMTVTGEDGAKREVMAGIAGAPACADGRINADDRPNL